MVARPEGFEPPTLGSEVLTPGTEGDRLNTD